VISLLRRLYLLTQYHSIFTTEYSKDLSIKPVGGIWHGGVSNLIIMFNDTFVLPQTLVDGGKQGWRFTGGFPLTLHREFQFRSFRGHSAKMTVYRGFTVPT
jgi:hypothetical protein